MKTTISSFQQRCRGILWTELPPFPRQTPEPAFPIDSVLERTRIIQRNIEGIGPKDPLRSPPAQVAPKPGFSFESHTPPGTDTFLRMLSNHYKKPLLSWTERGYLKSSYPVMDVAMRSSIPSGKNSIPVQPRRIYQRRSLVYTLFKYVLQLSR